MPKFNLEPAIEGNVRIGVSRGEDSILAGKLSEWGPPKHVWLDISKEFVGIVIGQRGSGKSFSLGSLLEAICTSNKETTISKRKNDRAVLLLDPTGNFWTTSLPLRRSGSKRIMEQEALFEGWDIEIEKVNSEVWLPAGFRLPTDNPLIKDFYFDTSDLDQQDWADILGINLMSEPQGMLLADTYFKLKTSGWDSGSKRIQPKINCNLQELIYCLENDIDLQERDSGNGTPSGYALQTIRTLTRNLKTYSRYALFSGGTTKLTDLLKPGRLTVVMLPYRVGRNLRSVMTRVIIKKILRDREVASQIQNRLDFEELVEDDIKPLREELSKHIPRTIVAMDEAQELLGDRGGIEREALEDFCLIGRNYGLSMIIATQRPETNAISPKVRDQAGIWLIHNLGSQANINIVENNLISRLPSSINDGHRDLDFSDLIRSLSVGQALVASKLMETKNKVQRIFVMDVRPRVTIHGGEAS